MPDSIGSATPSNGGQYQDTRGRVVVLEMQVVQFNHTLSQHLDLIRQLTASVARLEATIAMSRLSVQEEAKPTVSSKHRKHRH
jgi:hypothetical protein